MANSEKNYKSTLQKNAQSKGVVGKSSQKTAGKSNYPKHNSASPEATGQKMPQRRTHKTMSGMDILNKLAAKQAKPKAW